MSNFSNNLKYLLSENSISQQQLADAIGISQQTVSRYANGITEPDIASIIKIASFFHATTDFVLGVESEQNHEGAGCKVGETELYLISRFRKLRGEGQSEAICFINYLISKSGIQSKLHGNTLDISILDEKEQQRLVDYIKEASLGRVGNGIARFG